MPRFMPRLLSIATVMLLALPNSLASAQGLLVNVNPDESVRLPRPPGIHPPPVRPTPAPPPTSSYKIKELSVQAKLVDQIAQVQVSQSFVNTGSSTMEICFVFPLPYEGAIDRLTLLVDGKEYEAKLLEAKQARDIYEAIVRKNRDPALLEWVGQGMFKTSVFPVPPGEERTVTLRYSQLCRRADGLTDFSFPLATAKYTSQPVEKIAFRLTIASDDKIKNVYSPTHEVEIQRGDDEHATITYAKQNIVPVSNFRLLYDVGRDTVSTKVLSYRPETGEDGYFLLLASPSVQSPDRQRPAKSVVFVVDRSGSMQGKKIEQARGASKFVLNNLREGDTFNIVAYDSTIESFRPEMARYDEETRRAAIGFVEGIYAGGSTNIDGALKSALAMFQDSARPNYLIFLTDGLPTIGEMNEMKIAQGAHDVNSAGARVFSFGVGYDVNSRLLDRLSAGEQGKSFFVTPDEDIEQRVSQMYSKISAPVMTDVKIAFDVEGLRTEDGQAVNRVYPSSGYDLFAGDQLVVVGRYKKSGAAKVTVTGQVSDSSQSFDFPATFVTRSSDQSYAFVEKLWAMRRIGEIIDELDLKGHNAELVKELVTLSTRHGILTRYTSFLADENSPWRNLAGNTARAEERVQQLKRTAGKSAFGQRRSKKELREAKIAKQRQSAAQLSEDASDPSAGSPSRAGSSAPRASRQLRPGPAGGRGAGRGQGKGQGQSESRASTALVRVGNKAFYRRDGRLIDSTVTEAMEKGAEKIERYSAEYFQLTDKHGDEVAPYLAIDEPIVIELGGKTYLIE